jgi:hypothetical protein
MCQPTEREKILILVRVERFANADPTLLETSLSVAASLALQLDQAQCSVGLSTNARLTGGGEPTLHISSSPGHLSHLLETLARIEPEPAEDCVLLLRRGPVPSGNVTVVCFTYAADAGWEDLRTLLRLRRASLVSVICGATEPNLVANRVNERLYRLEDLQAE